MAVENSFHNEFNIKNGEKTMSWAYRSGIVVLKITTRRTTIGVRKSLDTSGKNLTTGPPRHVRKSPGGRLNKKDRLSRYGDSHVKDKTAARTSYL